MVDERQTTLPDADVTAGVAQAAGERNPIGWIALSQDRLTSAIADYNRLVIRGGRVVDGEEATRQKLIEARQSIDNAIEQLE